MGLFEMIASVFGYSKREARIIVIGLDNSGKTTLINHLKPKKVSLLS
jgi:ADP-ribosylation factor-like protein 6